MPRTPRTAARAGLVAYLALVAWLTLGVSGESASGMVTAVRDVVLRTGVSGDLANPVRVEFVLNVLLLVPVPVLGGLVWPRLNWRDWTALAFVITSIIETLQALGSERSASFSDIAANTLGGALGGLLITPIVWGLRISERTRLTGDDPGVQSTGNHSRQSPPLQGDVPRRTPAMTLTSPPDVHLHQRAPSDRWRTLRALPWIAAGLDAVIIAATVLIAAIGRRSLDLFLIPGQVAGNLWFIGAVILVFWLAANLRVGAYSPGVFGVGTEEYKFIVRGAFMTAGLVGIASYLTRFELSRGFFLITFVLGIPALVTGRFILRRAIHRLRRHGHLVQRTLVIGPASAADEIAAVLMREPWLGYSVVGVLTPARETAAVTGSGHRVLGNSDDVVDIALSHDIDVVLVGSGGFGSAADVRQLVWDLEDSDIQVVVAPGVTDVSSGRVTIRPAGGVPLVHLDPPSTLRAAHWGKRLFDVVGAGLLIIAASPILAAAAIAIKRADGGPVLFRQTRVGRHGEVFGCLKLRTMVVDAEQRLEQLHAETGHGEGLFKMKDDPRITGPGQFLRRYSLDELPQLFNVMRGDMSLVGPRPPLPSEVETYDAAVRRRLHVRPGMTGLWQVSGRSDLSWSEAVRLDLYYVDNWSMLQDLTILFRTVGAVLGSRGAY